MITVSIGGKDVVVKPKHLIDYVEKVDFIKTRRGTPYDLVRDFPKEKDLEGTRALVEIAMRTVYTNSSSVSIDEELCFDRSEEGFYWEIWKCLPELPLVRGKPPETAREGINRAKRIWESGTSDEKNALRFAIASVDERSNLGNFEGPSETSPPGQQQTEQQPSP